MYWISKGVTNLELVQVCYCYCSQLWFLILTADDSGDVLPPLPQFPHPEQQSDDDLVMGSSEPHNGNHGQDHSDVETSSSVEGDSNSCSDNSKCLQTFS